MEARKWNELKMATLEQLLFGSLTSRSLSRSLNISVENASMVLLRTHRQKLVDRTREEKTFPRKAFQYQITDRGRERLDYLRRELEK